MSTYDLMPSGDFRNDGWTLVGGSTQAHVALSDSSDSTYVSAPASKGGVTVSFPVDISTANVPEGAVITSVTVMCRLAKNTNVVGSTGTPAVTVELSAGDDTARFSSRTVFPTSTITDVEVATYRVDALGQSWDIERLNKVLARVLCHDGRADAVRVYRFWCRVNYRVRPSLSIIEPAGTVLTSSPTITWSYSQTLGDALSRTTLRVYTTVQVADSSFNADVTTPVFEASVSGDKTSVTLPGSLPPGDYYLYIRVRSIFGAVSVWVRRLFTVRGPSPAIPGDDNADGSGTPGVGTVSVVPDSYASAAALTMRDASNLLSVQQADFETATDAIEYVGTNCTPTRDTSTSFLPGSGSMKLTAASAATMNARTTLVEVAASTPVTARAQVRAASTGRTVNLSVLFYDQNFDALAGTLTASVTDSASTWKEVTVTGTTPATAAHARVQIEVASPASGEVHHIDRVGLMYGTGSAWSAGGHMSRNLLTAFLATGDDPSDGTAWSAGNPATTVARAAVSGTGSHGSQMWQMNYAGAPATIAFRAAGTVFSSTATGTGYTLNRPTGVASGDLLVAFVTSTEHGTITPPSGWTTVNTASLDEGSTDVALWILKRTAGASEPSTWTGTLSDSSGRRAAVVLAYSGAADASEQFLAETVRTDAAGAFQHTTPTVNNTDINAWRLSAFAFRHTASGGSMTANTQAPTGDPFVEYIGAGTPWTTTSSTSSYTINRPSGVKSGHLMIATVNVFGSTTVTAPTGWSVVRQVTRADNTGPCTLAVLKRTAGSSEPASWTGTLSSSHRPIMTGSTAYGNAADASEQFLTTSTSQVTGSDSGSSITTATVTNDDSRNWRVAAFSSTSSGTGDWTSSEVSERVDAAATVSGGLFSPNQVVRGALYDSNTVVSTGDHSRTGSNSASWYAANSWIGIIKAVPGPPPPPPNETKRAETTIGSADPYLTMSVFGSAGVVATGNQSVTGTFTASAGTEAASAASWIGLIKPTSAAYAGQVEAYTSTMVDISKVDPKVLELAGNKVTLTASFLGSPAAGTPYLKLEFYRANRLIRSEMRQGTSFETAKWTKSAATFDLPEGTTRIKAYLLATDRAVSDKVNFDRVSIALGESTVWRNGTGRTAHPIWTIPEVQYSEDDGTGYGQWKPLPGAAINPPGFDQLTGQLTYMDHTIVPLVPRKYRVQTVSYGLAGDRYASGWGPASDEVRLEAAEWWIKDIHDPDSNMLLKVSASKGLAVGTTSTAAVFQPLGEDLPVVLTEGYKGETFELDLHMRRSEFAQLRKMLGSGRTLFLQSSLDQAWWVRSIGDLKADTIAWTGKHATDPLKKVSVTFVEVKPEV